MGWHLEVIKGMYFRDHQLDTLWQTIISVCPTFGEEDLPGIWAAEMDGLGERKQLVSSDMYAIRVFTGLAVLSRHWSYLSQDDRGAILNHLARFSRHYPRPASQLAALAGVVFEIQVFARFALANLGPRFVKPSNREKRPDILLQTPQVFVECKNLAPGDFEDRTVDGICATIRKHVQNANAQILAYAGSGPSDHIVVIHLPPDPRGFFRKSEIERMSKLLTASHSTVRDPQNPKKRMNVLFVESSLSRLYSRPAVQNEPMDYWHTPTPFINGKAARVVWDLFMSMEICPYEGYAYPLLMAYHYSFDKSPEERVAMKPELAMKYWDEWQARSGVPLDRFEMPPLAMFPQQDDLTD